MCCKGGAGHVSSCFSCVEVLVALYYTGVMEDKRDRFILSKGQASPLLYAVLADRGYFPVEDLAKFNKPGGPFAVHLQNTVPGVLASMGSLGMGFGLAAGMAHGMKLNRETGVVFCVVGDAECYEGSIWEGATYAAHQRLNNLVVVLDRNWMGATDFTEDSCALGDMVAKWDAFGWETLSVDGHSLDQLVSVLERVHSRRSDKPLMIVANTVKGHGISFMEGEPMWHSQVPRGELEKVARGEVGQG